MKRVFGAGVVLLIALNCGAFQFQVPLGGNVVITVPRTARVHALRRAR